MLVFLVDEIWYLWMYLVLSLLQHLFEPLSTVSRKNFSIYNRLTRSDKYDRREPFENVGVIPRQATVPGPLTVAIDLFA